MSASPILSIAQCLYARVNNNAMNLPIKLSSEKQKEIELLKKDFWTVVLVESLLTRTIPE